MSFDGYDAQFHGFMRTMSAAKELRNQNQYLV